MSLSPVERYLSRFFAKLDATFAGDVLDVGCGDGRIAASIAQTAVSVTAIDAVSNESWKSIEMENLSFQVADAEALPFASNRFDMTIAVNMLHHTKNPVAAVEEMVRVCRPGGKVIVIEPNRYNPLGYVHLTLMGDHQHFPTKRFRELMSEGAGEFRLRRFECHCYPAPSGVIGLLERLEDMLDLLPMWRPFIFYNAAFFEKGSALTTASVATT